MILDVGDRRGEVLRAGICVVGAGPAGITLARALSDDGHDVLILEAGRFEDDPATQDLAGGVVSGEPFVFFGERDLGQLRIRRVGGSSNHWTGMCRPLDPVDFLPLAARGDTAWPFDRGELDPHYRAAQVDCELGPFEYRADAVADAVGVEAPATDGLVTQVLQFSPPTRFGERYRADLERRDIRIVVGANVTALRATPDRSGIRAVEAAGLDGSTITVEADRYVLATGGFENARLLLVGDGGRPIGGDLVGRFFAEHPSVGTVRVVGGFTPDQIGAFQRIDPVLDGRPTPLRFVLSPTPDAMAEWAIPNVAVTLQPSLLGQRFAFQDAQGQDERIAPEDVGTLATYRGGAPEHLFGAVVWEQQPNPDSRVLLDGSTDALGMPRTAVDWRLTPQDRAVPERAFAWLAHELGRVGLGRTEVLVRKRPAGEADVECSSHHMGTTRIDVDPARGVVDPDLRVHGVANLWVVGSSVFPTGGWSNPTLTIVALSRRLAAHLSSGA